MNRMDSDCFCCCSLCAILYARLSRTEKQTRVFSSMLQHVCFSVPVLFRFTPTGDFLESLFIHKKISAVCENLQLKSYVLPFALVSFPLSLSLSFFISRSLVGHLLDEFGIQPIHSSARSFVTIHHATIIQRSVFIRRLLYIYVGKRRFIV